MVLASLASATTAVRLSLHVLSAAIWVGDQLTVAFLLPTIRRLGPEAPPQVARAFARVEWPAFAVLCGSGIWNVVAVAGGEGGDWDAVLAAKVAVVAVAGGCAYPHGRSRTRAGLAAFGALAGVASLVALVLGVLLAG